MDASSYCDPFEEQEMGPGGDGPSRELSLLGTTREARGQREGGSKGGLWERRWQVGVGIGPQAWSGLQAMHRPLTALSASSRLLPGVSWVGGLHSMQAAAAAAAHLIAAWAVSGRLCPRRVREP